MGFQTIALATQMQPLTDAKSMLLINDGQPQPGKSHFS
jgi:hypothetical protein